MRTPFKIWNDVGVVTLYGWRPGKSDDQDTAETVTMLDRRNTKTLHCPDTDVAMMREM